MPLMLATTDLTLQVALNPPPKAYAERFPWSELRNSWRTLREGF